ncbi:MAG: hypothetical protein QW500_00515 [Candidatus Micrarchaeia archaeon]
MMATTTKKDTRTHSQENSHTKMKRAKEFIAMLMVGASLACPPSFAEERNTSVDTELCRKYIDAKKAFLKTNGGQEKKEVETARKDLIRSGGFSAPLNCIQGSNEKLDPRRGARIDLPKRNKENTWVDILKFAGTVAVIIYVVQAIKGETSLSIFGIIRNAAQGAWGKISGLLWKIYDKAKNVGKRKDENKSE